MLEKYNMLGKQCPEGEGEGEEEIVQQLYIESDLNIYIISKQNRQYYVQDSRYVGILLCCLILLSRIRLFRQSCADQLPRVIDMN